ncbi:sigma-70 family RNA polymerase sigma factor [Rhodopirellula bahusiensis]|uniref:sigma-70 family RNA polymerase sigma factor n=1 Tax=Rhodopirellula bahusiensis TaxID=2014065 RepID=UPI0032679C03
MESNPPKNSDYIQVDRLLKAARNGDAAALSTLFGLYQNYVRLLAASQIRARLRVRASESDVVQETLLNAARGFSEFRGNTGGEFVTWLRAILTRKIQTLIQTHVDAQVRDVRREISLDTVGKWVDQSSVRLENVLAASDPTPVTQLANQERSVCVANALAQLSEDHREVLLLRSIEGLSFPEVADQMNRSHGAVRMLWLRAIEALRDKLQTESEP